MKKILNILTVGIFSLATSTTISTTINQFNIIKKHLQNENTTNETSLFNNYYGYLNNSDWITNHSTVDNKFYNYDTSALKNYTFANARNTFLVDTTGNLVYNNDIKIPDKEKINIANTKQEMNNYRKITTLKTNPNHSDAYNFSDYQQNSFVGDNNNWSYLQFGGLEQDVDISSIPSASKIENNSHLSENLALYYIANAAINNKISLTIAHNISQEFIKKSSLKEKISNNLTNTIIDLIFKNTNVFKFINSSPLFLNIKDYSLNFIFDYNNNVIAIYYTKWNVQNITQNINYHYKNDFSTINDRNWSKTSDNQIMLDWTKYGKNWEQFANLYPVFSFNNAKLAINNMGKNEENTNLTGDTNNITTDKNLIYGVQNNYNVVIGYENIIQLASIQICVYHDDKNIYWQWNASVTSSPNLIAGCLLTIDLDNTSFQFKQ